jgi:hypothetical protein
MKRVHIAWVRRGGVGAALAAVAVALAGVAGSTDPAGAVTQTVTITWGPYDLAPATEAGPSFTDNALDVGVQLPCTDCYITEIVPRLVFGDGTSANFHNGTMLHHMVLFNGARSDATCSGSIWDLLGERIFASGNERTVFGMPPGYGYYSAAGDSWNIVHDIMNMQPISKTVYLEFTFKYKPGTESVKPVTPVWLDVNNCGSSEYPVPAGYVDTHWDWTSTMEGDVVSIGGHVHNWGINIASELVQTGDYFCDSVAGYAPGSPFAPAPVTPGGEGHVAASNVMNPGDPDYMGRIEDMSGCAPMFRIHAGDTIRLHSRYNAAQAEPDVMGIMVAYVHETTEPPNPDDDGDGYTDVEEAGRPLCGDGRNEDDMDDAVVDDGCPGGPPQAGSYSEAQFNIGSDPLMPCGTSDWPSDFVSGSVPDSTDRINIGDLASFVAPDRHLGTSPGDALFDSRWDLSPGRGAVSDWISVLDLAALVAGQTAYPPMLDGVRAFGGPTCPWPE